MERLIPNAKCLCIAFTHDFTIGKVYDTNDEGIIIDNDGDERPVISVEDDYFFELFTYL